MPGFWHNIRTRVLRKGKQFEQYLTLQNHQFLTCTTLTHDWLLYLFIFRLGTFLFTRILKEGHDKRFNKVRDNPKLFLVYWTIQGVVLVLQLGRWGLGLWCSMNNIWGISWQSVLFVEEPGIPRENHRPVARHWQILSHNIVSCTPRPEWGSISQI